MALCLALVNLLAGVPSRTDAPNTGLSIAEARSIAVEAVVLCTPAGMIAIDAAGQIIPLDGGDRVPFCPDCLGAMTGFGLLASAFADLWPPPPTRPLACHRAEPPVAGPRRLTSNAVPRAPPPSAPLA